MNFAYDAIEKIKDIDFFKNCGSQGTLNNVHIEFVDKITASKTGGSIEWENYTLEQANEITSFLDNKAQLDYNLYWNEYVDEFKKYWDSEIYKGMLEVTKKIDINNELLITSAQWDLLHYVMEESYKKYNIPTFFYKLFSIYEAGHYPCGVKDYSELKNPIILVY